MKFLSVVAGVSAAVLATSAASGAEPDRSTDRIKAHVAFLADDLMQGREAGSVGHAIAANYVASQLAQMGVKPGAADGSYFQSVPMSGFRSADQGRFSIVAKGGQTTPLVFGEDYLPGRNPLAATTALNTQMVFVGYGVVAGKRDDYARLDVRGKIVVALAGAPKTFQTEERAYYANRRTKRAEAARRGAVGFISVNAPSDEARQPFANSARQWQSWGMSWREPSGTPFAPAGTTPELGSISVKGAAKLFDGAPKPLAEIYAAAETGAPPRFALPHRLDVAINTELKSLDSVNVVGVIEGADPVLKNEVIVLSAHLDHIGVSANPVKGDAINNGALDNAGGVATTLEVARAFVGAQAPKRTLLFLLNTAEEKGLVGSEYFALNPTTRLPIVANVNLDMPILTYDFIDVVAFGAERSSLGAAVSRAGARMGVKLSPDPLPDEGLFTRSDHFRFVEAGVPSVFLMTGFENGGQAAFTGFLRDNYHKPSDDLALPIDYAVGAKFARLNYEIVREIADADQKPAWNKGDFFGELFTRRP
ncbi:M28 family metallopeptidase [Phenylobacterium sp.]|uniref:M28 family metallopeptidase n=1 Tax=Phenylobacterium sp. TaxID=1871053 RepID=UPI00286BF531|nr:M28 family metallopeptidase [Phenylobacterium sp.]